MVKEADRLIKFREPLLVGKHHEEFKKYRKKSNKRSKKEKMNRFQSAFDWLFYFF